MWTRFCTAAGVSQEESAIIVSQSVQENDDIPHNFGFLLLEDEGMSPHAKLLDLWYPMIDWNVDYIAEKFIQRFLQEESHPLWIQNEKKWFTPAWGSLHSAQNNQSEEDEWIYVEGTGQILFHLEKLREQCQKQQAFKLLKIVELYLNSDMYDSRCWKVMQRKNMFLNLITNPHHEPKYWMNENEDCSYTFVGEDVALARLRE
jgi:hypothetical protein